MTSGAKAGAAPQLGADVQALYTTDPGTPQLDIRFSAYSNLGAVSLTGRDLFIDFIEMPPRPVGGKMQAPTARIYLTHHAAKALADAIYNLLGDAQEKGRLETEQPIAARARGGKKAK
jgi:hypothetical protein